MITFKDNKNWVSSIKCCIINHKSHQRQISQKIRTRSSASQAFNQVLSLFPLSQIKFLNKSMSYILLVGTPIDTLDNSLIFLAGLSLFRSLFPCAINNWNKLNPKILNFISDQSFRNALTNFIWPSAFYIFNIHDHAGIKSLKMLQLDFRNHLRCYD